MQSLVTTDKTEIFIVPPNKATRRVMSDRPRTLLQQLGGNTRPTCPTSLTCPTAAHTQCRCNGRQCSQKLSYILIHSHKKPPSILKPANAAKGGICRPRTPARGGKHCPTCPTVPAQAQKNAPSSERAFFDSIVVSDY